MIAYWTFSIKVISVEASLKMILVTLLIIVIIYISAKIFRRWRTVQHLKKAFPNVPAHPITGVLLYFPRDPAGILTFTTNCIRTYGKNILAWAFMYDSVLLISDPVDVGTILANSNSKSAKKLSDYDISLPWLGNGLLTSNGEKWFQRRKIITPSFHFSMLEQFVEVFNRQSDIFVAKLSKLDGKGEYDIYNDVTHFTLDVICEASMGLKLNVQSEPNCEYAVAVKEMTMIITKQFFHIFKNHKFLFELTSSHGRRAKQLVKILHKFTKSVIRERRNLLIESQSKAPTSENKKMNLLDLLLHAEIDGKPLSDEDIREEVDTFMFAGHDTTASAISFALFHLSQNQEVQEKLYEELKEVLGENSSEKDITYQKLGDLKYLEMVIKETLRITPSLPFIGRQLTEDTPLNGTIVPSGMNAFLPIYIMQNDPDNFPNPEKFNPDRFVEQPNHPFLYVPFSAGARNCIGQKFAMLEMKTILAKVILKYKLLPAEKNGFLKLQADIVLRSENGTHIRVEKRSSKTSVRKIF